MRTRIEKTLHYRQNPPNLPPEHPSGYHAPTCYEQTHSEETMSPQLTAALVSACVSLSIVAISRWFFTRTDKRLPILIILQKKLLALQANPPVVPYYLPFHKVAESAEKLQPYFDQLRMVSFPRKICRVQRALSSFKGFDETRWKGENPSHRYADGLSGDEYATEIRKILTEITK